MKTNFLRGRNWFSRLFIMLMAACLLMGLTMTALAAEGSADGTVENTESVMGGSKNIFDMTDEEREAAMAETMAAMGDEESAELFEFASDASETANGYWKIATVIVVVIAVAALATAMYLVVSAAKSKKKASTKTNVSLSAVIAVMLALIITVNLVTSTYANTLDSLLTTYSGVEVDSKPSDWINLAYTIAGEGMTLMKNDHATLPLASGTKVNLIGYYAYNPYYSGTGSGSTVSTNAVDIMTGLQNAGFEVNSALLDAGVYALGGKESYSVGFNGGATESIEEVSIDQFVGDASFESMKNYSDVAIVVLGRCGGEGSDLTNNIVEAGRMYLQLSSKEEAILKKAGETFNKLIVVYNGGNPLEMGFVDQYGVDAFVWAGLPGEYGFESLGKILSGEVNPSGHLVDTWVYDSYSAPASENFGDQQAEGVYGTYVDYVEGIYIGYKWYETAYEEGAVITNTTNGKTYDYNDYYSVVAYPFGYGLSYTSFEQSITGGTLLTAGTIDPTKTYTVEVTVTNTGSVAGKDAVELFMTAPYTDYDKANGIEKAQVALVDYGKTKQIEPGKSEVVTLTIDPQDIASYDNTHNNGDGTVGSYMLEAGEYTFSIRSDSHTMLDEVSTSVGSTHFYSGDSKRDSDVTVAYNQFSDASRGIYLSRQDGFSNYEAAMKSVSPILKDVSFDNNPAYYDPALDAAAPSSLTAGVDYGASGNLTLADVKGLAYDDPKWDDLIKQVTLDEMVKLVKGGLSGNPSVPSVGVSAYSQAEGTCGITSMYANLHTVSYPCVELMAATFNKEIAYSYGAMLADQAHELGISSLNIVAMNMHRWYYGGRNFEYFSEDPCLSAGQSSLEELGCTDRGLITYTKHFALNEMETNRSRQLHTYANEQTIREVYLKPFEKAVKVGHTMGMMSSMNYIGDIYTSASIPLLENVLRGEWGFKGAVMTDMAEGSYATDSTEHCIRAGTDFWLSIIAPRVRTDSAADIFYLQRAAKHILYSYANMDMIGVNTYNWHGYVTVFSVAFGALAVGALAAIVLRNRKKEQV